MHYAPAVCRTYSRRTQSDETMITCLGMAWRNVRLFLPAFFDVLPYACTHARVQAAGGSFKEGASERLLKKAEQTNGIVNAQLTPVSSS